MTTAQQVRAARTAIARPGLSRPVQVALDDNVLRSADTVFDYGCGRGGDVDRLSCMGVYASGWDPAYAPETPKVEADVVNLGYVLNVIEAPRERAEALRDAWRLARRTLIVAARPDWDADAVRGTPHADGLITSRGTFQKFFSQDELRDLIAAACQSEPVAAGPGIFYVFRDPADATHVRARRFQHRRLASPRPRVADQLWEAHRDLLEPIATFWESRGRHPERREIPNIDAIESAVGSIRRASSVVRRVVGDDRFATASSAAARDLLVFLALEAFRGRPKFSGLPDDIQLDVRAHFGTYKSACAQADDLLFSMADAERLDRTLRSVPFGKVLPDAVYVHVQYLEAVANVWAARVGSGEAA